MFNLPSFSIRNTIFVRLIVTFLTIMLPIFLMGIYLYQWIIQTTSEDISKTAVSQITFYLTDLGNEIDRIKLLQYSLMEDEDLNAITLTWNTMNNIQRTDKINILLKRLYAIQNSSMYIKDVSVHISPISKSVSSVNGVGNLDTEKYSRIRSKFGSGGRLIALGEGLYLSAAKQSAIRTNQPLFIIDIELDTRKLQEALSQFNTYSGSGTILYSEDTGMLLASGSAEGFRHDADQLAQRMNRGPADNTVTYEIMGNRYYTVHANSSYLNMSIYRFIPVNIIQKPLDKFYWWAWLFASAVIVIIAVYTISTYKFIHKPLLTLVRSFRRIENEDLDVVIEHGARDEFGYLYARFNQMVATLRSLIDQVYKQKILAQRAELKQLQSQINPHFLFNSLFILRTMAKTGDVDRIEQFTTQLGEYFQFVTRNASDEVSLKQEIHHARTYTEIQQMRFSRRIRVIFEDLPEEIEQVSVPRLIVQPLIENAFEHSLERKVANGLMRVQFETDGSDIRILVEDNGDDLTDEVLRRISESLAKSDDRVETTGMVNIHKRLLITFGHTYGLEVERSELGGLKATIRLPNIRGDARVSDADRR
ncbi:sensor histidine kinase [Paenibacillus aestuarii]|uniref:Sensor histidine kinase n=1 Tax=Paenibacillus aestuarii TaxID=516965 RepID=A0ABW0K906_9BACL|nr:histidine kinase [Paenibacillus aestuarii]